MLVLIDTWWNVNAFRRHEYIYHVIVLIDTWWNVNASPGVATVVVSGFNRYMVECEFIVQTVTIEIIYSFNRYMVECEYLTKQLQK